MPINRLHVVPPVRAGAILGPPLRRLAVGFDGVHCHELASVTDALCAAARAIGLRDGDELLVPRPYDARALRALRAAGIGARPYPCDVFLAPDADELNALLTPRVRALCLVHRLGLPQDLGRWRAWCDERGLALLEDATHAFGAAPAGRPVGTLADAAVCGLAECLGTPGGALLLTRDGAPPSVPAASALTSRLLWRLGDERVAAARRARYAELVEELYDIVPVAFSVLPAGASPYAVPVRPHTGDELADRLARHGVTPDVGWPAPAGTLLLPAHQELRRRDVRQIVDAARGRRPGGRREELSLEPLAGFDALPGDWARLAAARGTIFATPEWLGTWWSHRGREGELRLYCCRDRRGRVAAILPLEVRAVGPVALMRFCGHGPSDELGPICAAADRPAVARALLRAVREAGADVLVGELLPGDAGWEALLGARVLSTEGSPVAHLEARRWDAQLRRWTPSVGRMLGRATRKLEREHEVRRRPAATDPAGLDADLDKLFALHDARWPGGTVFSTRDRAFHRDFARLAQDRGWLALTFLEVDGEDVAAVYDLRFGDAELQYQQGRLPAWDARSVGTIALLGALRSACEDGLREYRFLRGDEEYKYRYADADPRLRTVAVARGRGAAGALALASVVPVGLLKPARRWVAAA